MSARRLEAFSNALVYYIATGQLMSNEQEKPLIKTVRHIIPGPNGIRTLEETYRKYPPGWVLIEFGEPTGEPLLGVPPSQNKHAQLLAIIRVAVQKR